MENDIIFSKKICELTGISFYKQQKDKIFVSTNFWDFFNLLKAKIIEFLTNFNNIKAIFDSFSKIGLENILLAENSSVLIENIHNFNGEACLSSMKKCIENERKKYISLLKEKLKISKYSNYI